MNAAGASALTLAAALSVAVAQGQVAARPPPGLPMLPVIRDVRLETARDHVTLVEDLDLPRGDWRFGDLDFYVAFGSPSTPRAFDARLFAELLPDPGQNSDEVAEPVVIEPASRRPSQALALLGRPQMAGVVVHLREPAFRRALAASGVARLRLRSLLEMPAEDPSGAHEVVARLGSSGGPPLALERIEFVALDTRGPIARAEAHLCGPDADPYPLAVSVAPAVAAGDRRGRGPVAPVLAVRHSSDDLCLRFWLR
jgi:hypothetical protein